MHGLYPGFPLKRIHAELNTSSNLRIAVLRNCVARPNMNARAWPSVAAKPLASRGRKPPGRTRSPSGGGSAISGLSLLQRCAQPTIKSERVTHGPPHPPS